MLIAEINDNYFGIDKEDINIGNISAGKLANLISNYTSFNSMAFNRTAAIGNVTVGNAQMFIEAHGGKYYDKKTLGKAFVDYLANTPEYLKDTDRPIKSKDSQLAIMFDAIQGEIQDEIGRKITGNKAQKIFRKGSFFLLTSGGEHQLQITNMKAMMLSKKVKTTSGEEISLYDAYVKDANGRIVLKSDVKLSDEEKSKFTRDLHGVNRALNGNYSGQTKTVLQRKWYGNLIMKFRKYLYPTYRARWASEHVDYERNTVEVGYLRYFYGTYLPGAVKALTEGKNGFGEEGLKPHEVYALRKAKMETAIYLGLTLLALAMSGAGDDKKKLSDGEKALLYFMNRLQADYEIYNGGLPKAVIIPFKPSDASRLMPNPFEEPLRQLKNPTASLRAIDDVSKMLAQLPDLGKEYTSSGPGYEKGDNAFEHKLKKTIPLLKQYNDLFEGSFTKDIDNRLGYFNLVNKNIEGVKVSQSR
jgi:hypothetical protein